LDREIYRDLERDRGVYIKVTYVMHTHIQTHKHTHTHSVCTESKVETYDTCEWVSELIDQHLIEWT
jgi:hypothetical protein